MLRFTSASGAPVIALITTRFIVTGGLISAISRLSVSSTPYHTLSMPSSAITGRIAGMVSRMIEKLSSTSPSRNSSAIIATRNPVRPKLSSVTSAASSCGTRSLVSM
jgi:hypothetical protein